MPDAGLTHIAIEVADLQRSIDFYAAYGGFEVVHRRDGIAWISDRTRPFALVLAARDEVHPVGPFAHLGFACRDRSEFEALVARAREEGRLRMGPHGDDGPAGTWAFLDDPDGNTYELSIGQSVAVAVRDGAGPADARRLAVVGVMGGREHAMPELAVPLGRGLARAGWHLLTGGGIGVMTSVSRGFVETSPRAGLCLGILRGHADGRPMEGYPNPFVELPIPTHLPAGDAGPDSRNHINILASTVVLALPGGDGTRSEIELAIAYGRPVAVHVDWSPEFATLPAFDDAETAIASTHRLLQGTRTGDPPHA